MAYFLKKTNNKKGTYLQIYSSFYDPQRGHTAHKAYKPSLILRTPILTVLTFTLKLIKSKRQIKRCTDISTVFP